MVNGGLVVVHWSLSSFKVQRSHSGSWAMAEPIRQKHIVVPNDSPQSSLQNAVSTSKSGTAFSVLDLLPLRAMRLNTDAESHCIVKTMDIEIGGVHDRRRSNPAAVRSSLTLYPLLQQFPPIREAVPLVGTQGSAIPIDTPPHRHRCPGDTQPHTWTQWPQD